MNVIKYQKPKTKLEFKFRSWLIRRWLFGWSASSYSNSVVVLITEAGFNQSAKHHLLPLQGHHRLFCVQGTSRWFRDVRGHLSWRLHHYRASQELDVSTAALLTQARFRFAHRFDRLWPFHCINSLKSRSLPLPSSQHLTSTKSRELPQRCLISITSNCRQRLRLLKARWANHICIYCALMSQAIW